MDEDNKPKKGLAAMLIADKGPIAEGEDAEMDEVSGEDLAVEDMMSALDMRDTEGFKIALNAFLDQR